MKHRTKFAFIAVAVMLSMILSACAPAAAPASVPASESAATSSASAPTGQTLTVWYLSVDPPAFTDVFQRWADKTGNKVELVAIPSDGFETQTQTRWAAGERPDIMEYHANQGFFTLNPEQNLQDLSGEDFVQRAPSLYPTLGTYKGKTYAAITSFPQVFGLYYNKPVFAEAGLNPPETIADLATICATLKEKMPDVVPIWESGGSVWPPQIIPASYMADADPALEQDILDKKMTLADPNSPYVLAMTAYDNLLKSGCFNTDITTAKFEDGIKAVAEGTAAMIALPPFVDRFNAALGDDPAKTDSTIGFAYPSSQGPRAWWIPSPTGSYFAPKTGDPAREAAALDFIRYATGEGYQQTIDESKTFPVLSGVNSPTDAQGLTLELKKAFDTNSGLGWGSSFPPGIQFDRIMSSLISGQATPAELGEQIQLQFEQGAKAQQLPGW